MKSLFLAVAVLSQVFIGKAFAGPITSGGGFAVVCRDSKGKISSAEVLDLYEARVKFRYTLLDSTNDVFEDFKNVEKNIDRLLDYAYFKKDTIGYPKDETARRLYNYLEKAEYLPVNFKLPEISDLGLFELPPTGCLVEQLAVYNDSTEKLKINSKIWNELDSLNQAALIYHEEWYRYERRARKAITSVETRVHIGRFFSKDSTPVIKEGTRATSAQGIIAGDLPVPDDRFRKTEFYYERNANILTVSFTRILGQSLYSPTVANLDVGSLSFVNKYSLSQQKNVVLTNATEPKVIKGNVQSVLRTFDFEIIVNPEKPLIARIIESGKVILEQQFEFMVTHADIFTPIEVIKE
jgi:hypothetical protein